MTRMKLLVFPALLALMLLADRAAAQAIIIDRRPDIPIRGSYQVQDVTVDARIREQVAEVQISQTFTNTGGGVLEAEFYFPLPDEGAIQDFVLLVDGKELPGKLLSREEARRIYEDIVRRRRDPALLEFVGRGLFKTSVFPIPAGQTRTVTLRYTHLCPRERDLVSFVYPMAAHKVTQSNLRSLNIRVSIDNKAPIKSIYSPSHDVTIKRHGPRSARISFEQHNVRPEADFRLFYAVADDAIGATLLSYRPSHGEDGYFLLLASPGFTAADRKPMAKTVIMVLDKSGSMQGKKIEQAREALRFVLDNLNEDDTFNIIVYDDRVETFAPELQRYSKQARRDAAAFVDNIRAGGSTNIDEALRTAMGMIHDETRPSYVLFLTDGLPTAGEKNEMRIADNVKNANKLGARLIAFGVGHDVNARLIDRLSFGNGGASEYVKPDEDIEASVSRFYSRLTAPVLANISITLGDVDVNRTYPRDLPDLFDGGQLVWVGRYTTSGTTRVKITGNVGGEKRTFRHTAHLAGSDDGSSHAFIEKLWAVRRVGHLIDQIDLHGRNSELINELVELSKRYGILTPYTSFLADERVRLEETAANAARANDEAADLAQVAGEAGVGQRMVKSELLRAARPQPTAAPVAYDKAGRTQQVHTVQNVGDKTFFRKQGRWIESTVNESEDAKAIVIKQFSDAYFELSRQLDSKSNQYLTFTEAVTVRMNNQVYRIEP